MTQTSKYQHQTILLLLLIATGFLGASFSTPEGKIKRGNHPDLLKFFPSDSDTINLQYNFNDNLDPTNNGYLQNLFLGNPSNINSGIQYDPETGQYIFNQTIGDSLRFRPSSTMNLDEYLQYDLKNSIKNYWREKVEAEGFSEQNGGIKPSLNIKGKGFESIFGSDIIDIKPQGSAELIFGIRSSRTDNPQIPERQRNITNFDFDQRIQANITGNIGDKMKLNFGYNTEATFDFENITKLEHTGGEDDIVKKIEAGNVSMPLSGNLITGSQSLFGISTKLQFGKLTATAVVSQQKGERSEIDVAGGAQTQEFEIRANEYEANRHYFISQYFRDIYDGALRSLPNVNTNIDITRIEVWVTNTNNTVTETRNFIAFADLGEDGPYINANVITDNSIGTNLPDNDHNSLYTNMDNNSSVRNIATAINALNGLGFSQSVDYEKLENARKLTTSEFTYNSKLGFISLNQSLNQDQVLAVAYEYTYLGQVYQVGDFSQDGVTGQDALFLKMLKATVPNVRHPLWDLMMKNVYSLGAFQVNSENFRLDIWYNNPETGVEINYIPKGVVDGIPLVQTIELDRLNMQLAAFPDGVFDFVDGASTVGGTINAQRGKVFFTTVEPFGKTLSDKLLDVANGGVNALDQSIVNTIVYQPLYDSTITAASQMPELNRFTLRGSYQSSSGSEISLNAINVPRGSVTVTAGGVQLVENQDYTVDYNLGRVRIINQGLIESQTPIKVSLESNSLFSIQTKTMVGTHLDYRVNKNLNVGATLMNLRERPLTQKVNIGNEPINNWIWGLNSEYQAESRLITKIVDKLPFFETKAKSNVSLSGEFAHLIPGHSKAIGKEGNSYIDDFEGSQSTIDLRAMNQWVMASTPQGQQDLFPEASLVNDLAYGYNRARVSWYIIDPLFFRNNNLTPGHISGNDNIQQNHRMREILEPDLFPNYKPPAGTATNISVFDVSFFPNERGPYNYDAIGSQFSAGLDANGRLNNPESRWGGLMRQLQTNDFEAANIEYIQFWMMDPFTNSAGSTGAPNVDAGNSTGGDLYFNLGNISEDILRDSRKMFENGLPGDGNLDPNDYVTTAWGNVPTTQVVLNAFDNTDLSFRPNQDIGFDGLNDADENSFFSQFLAAAGTVVTNTAELAEIQNDPSADNFNYYRDDDYDNDQVDIIGRYKYYNNQQGNSFTDEQSQGLNVDGYPTAATTLPDVEDINQDNNLSESESYFQYRVSLRPQDMVVGRNYITDKVIEYPTINQGKPVTWYQFKIPVMEPDRVINNIPDFRSIRFFRMFLKGFQEEATLRFARLELVRGEWRRYFRDLRIGVSIVDDFQTTFNVSAVNVEENGSRTPVNYVLPPGIDRQINVGTANLAQLNEQALVLETCNLTDGDARAAYRNTNLDVRNYKKLKMFVHAEAEDENNDPINYGEATVFLRLGSDFDDNYYEYEIPLNITPWGNNSAEDVWPEDNNIEIEFEILKQLKRNRNSAIDLGTAFFNEPYTEMVSSKRVTVKGNPVLSAVKTVMIGVRNPKKTQNPWLASDDGQPICIEVWANELRLTDFDERGGWAAIARMNTNLADLGDLAIAANMSTPGFGSIEKRVSERQRETIRGIDVTSNIELGKLLPEKAGVKIPMFVSFSENVSSPQFDPLQPDLEFNQELHNTPDDQRLEKKQRSETLTKRRSINFTNVRINPKKESGEKKKKSRFYNISNFSVSYGYNEQYFRDINTEYRTRKNFKGGLQYSFNPNPKPISPFKNVGFIQKSKFLKFVKDFNFYLKPKQFSFRTDIDRVYSESLIRSNTPGAIVIPQFNKTFTWDRVYDLKYDLTRALKINFNANNRAIIGEPNGRVNRVHAPDQYQSFKDSVWQSIGNFGQTTNYNHNLNVTYKVPLNKIPFTDWLIADVQYTAGYDWLRASFAQDSLGHTIQNSRNISVNIGTNMNTLYNKVGFLKKANQSYGGRGRGRKPSRGVQTKKPTAKKNPKDSTDTEKIERELKGLQQAARVLMMLKNVSASFSMIDGTLLPGYNRNTHLLGMDPNFNSPGAGFAFGLQQDTAFGMQAAENGWVVKNPFPTTRLSNTHTQTFNMSGTLEPINGMRIDLSADRNLSDNNQFFIRWNNSDTIPEHMFQQDSWLGTGNFSTSIITWNTAFTRDNVENESPVFQQLLDNRLEVSKKLALENALSTGNIDTTGYYDGYNGTSQDVLIPAFISAYTGKDPKSVSSDIFSTLPLPNWRISYDGLSRIEFLKKYIKKVTISHGYISSFNVASYTTNLNYRQNPGSRDQNSGNFLSEKVISAVTISEQFSPLINIDVRLKNDLAAKIELKQDRNLSLSLVNNQLTEIAGREYVFGTGYIFKDVKFKIGRSSLSSDLDVRADVSIRENKNIIRKIVEEQTQVTSGQKIVSIKTSASYILNKQLSVRFFFDRIVTDPFVSTAFRTANTNSGLSLRFQL